MGFLGPENYINQEVDIDLDERSNFKADHNIHKTSHPKVFAAGIAEEANHLLFGR